MASGNSYFDDFRTKSEVMDTAKSDDMSEVIEYVNDPAHIARKPTLAVSSSVRELLECPVCLNAMYPPIHQVISEIWKPLLPLLFSTWILHYIFLFTDEKYKHRVGSKLCMLNYFNVVPLRLYALKWYAYYRKEYICICYWYKCSKNVHGIIRGGYSYAVC